MAFQKLCQLSDLRNGHGKEFLLDGRIVAVFLNKDELRAVDGICAHQGGPISQGFLDGKCITCPWHGWQYDLSNGQNLLSGKKMLDCFPIEVRSDEIWVDVAEPT